ncbi:general transcription factor 3C polypeptide 5-like [Dysidea avara]|uniref:general transcription factor 3C polypeptide 5-like n=1 Tax=Dysidea avara TaxID=196820 RepID=UPI0033185A8F
MEENEAGTNELVTLTLPGNLDELFCVEYPGNVQNVHNALATLGGESSVARAHHSSTPLGLKFRPDDIYCTPLTSPKEKATGLVLKVKRRRKKGDTKWSKCETEVLGVVGSKYEFKGMLDYQVFPPYETMATTRAYSTDALHDISLLKDETIPPFVLPTPLTKQDRPLEYSYQTRYRTDIQKKSYSYSKPLKTIAFDHKGPVPSEPTDSISPPSSYTRIHKLFEDCPVWTRNALTFHAGVLFPTYKAALPFIVYCFSNGPWKTAYIRFGYDPREHPEAKLYQVIELRVPRAIDLLDAIEHQPKKKDDVSNSNYTFSANIIPPKRGNYYRLCDIKDDTMQQVIHSNDGKEKSVCNEEYGWCEADTYGKLREMANKYMLARAKELNI